MAKEKSLGPNGLVVEFYVLLWDLIGEEFAKMINCSCQIGRLPYGMTCGFFILLHKGGPQESLHNWCPILY